MAHWLRQEVGFGNASPAQPAASTPDPTLLVSGPPVEAQRPIFEKREDGSAHFEFCGIYRSPNNMSVTEKADTSLTAFVTNATVTAKSVTNRFHGEQSADVRYHNANIEATEGDIDIYVKGGRSKWITGATKESVMDMGRMSLLKTWEAYRKEGRNPSIRLITTAVLNADYKDSEEGLERLRRFIIRHLAVTNGEKAD